MRATRAMRAKDPTHTLRTELATARRELWATQLKLARCKRELRSARNLLATLAHEINNPLAYIQSNLCSLSRYASKIASYAEAVTTAEPLLGRAHDDETRGLSRRLAQLRETLKLDFVLEDLEPMVQQSLRGVARVQRVVLALGEAAAVSPANDTSGSHPSLNELPCRVSTGE
jgi:signal transduction histidine kinase